MRSILVLIGLLLSASAFAQSPPPTVGGKPLVQIKPKGNAAKPAAESPATKLKACLEVEDGSKERLDCYDAVIAPKPTAGKGKPPVAKSVTDCRAIKEQDERLACFNGFATKLPPT